MTHQVFTDDVMVILAGAMFAYLLVVIGIQVYWRDGDMVWTLAIETMQGIFTYYYVVVALNQPNQIIVFPIIGLIGRPTLAGTWLIIALYVFYRLYQKSLLRRKK